MKLNHLIASCVAAAILATTSAVHAGSISLGDFGPTAVLTDLNDLGVPSPSQLVAPLTIGIYTFTTDDGQLRYTHFGLNNSNALGNNTDLGFLNIAIAPGANVTKFGFLVGLAGEAQHHKETISFFDTNNILLGSILVSSLGGFQFVGFENTAGFIGRALITDIDLNSTVVTVDNLIVNPVPLPPSILAQLTGLALLGLLAWRRKLQLPVSA